MVGWCSMRTFNDPCFFTVSPTNMGSWFNQQTWVPGTWVALETRKNQQKFRQLWATLKSSNMNCDFTSNTSYFDPFTNGASRSRNDLVGSGGFWATTATKNPARDPLHPFADLFRSKKWKIPLEKHQKATYKKNSSKSLSSWLWFTVCWWWWWWFTNLIFANLFPVNHPAISRVPQVKGPAPVLTEAYEVLGELSIIGTPTRMQKIVGF